MGFQKPAPLLGGGAAAQETPTSQQYQEKFQSLYTRFFNQTSSEESSDEDGGSGRSELAAANAVSAVSTASAAGVTQAGEPTDLSRQLHNLISSNSELGSRLLSLLLVSSGNAKEIICAVNKGDLDGLKKLDLKKSQLESQSPAYTEKELHEFKKVELEKRRKNTEASARFRVRKKQRQYEKAEKLKQLNAQISELYGTIDRLLDENKFWKDKLEDVNERKSREMLDGIKRRRLKEKEAAVSN
ncbi:LANO_0H19922g1_1 [Lachancea nothofagi CBS 11611]|uniref:LANO_0H19922g1_1 n=1 Tax=Lachancea nothofagi CBS 11611 TaxID=1266666 RepID=A0A1G4KN98_9SACH|nr:LANO_0H19922g1_1 [Lachancea nothofagi CBS 11611]